MHAARVDRTRYLTLLCLGATIVLLVLAAYEVVLQAQLMQPQQWGEDYRFYRSVGERWVQTGEIYRPYQLTGPYDNIVNDSVLYPPPAVLWFAPFVVLPALAWWVLPLGTIAVQVARQRPAPWSWPLLALILIWPRTLGGILFGNSDMWIAGALAAGALLGWPGAFAMLKPTVAPLALVFIRDRRFWLGVLAFGVVSLLFLGRWTEYLAAIRNVRALPLSYSLLNVPIVAAPVLVWLARDRTRDRRPTTIR